MHIGKVVTGKCPRCKILVETDIHPLACEEHRQQVDREVKAALKKLAESKKK